MRNLIKNNPKVFGLILLLGILCGACLCFFMVSNLFEMAVPASERSIDPTLVFFLFGATVFMSYIVFVVDNLLRILFKGISSTATWLGQWLVKTTGNETQEG